MNMIWHNREQYPVGQGFFHAGQFGSTETTNDVFSYVYDCGAMEKYKAAREREIDHYLRNARGKEIDLLFISHLHADHVSGLPQLLDRSSGIRARTIILPYTDAAERIFVFAKDAALGAWGDDDSLAVDLTANPLGTLSERFSPDEIVLIHASDPDETEPDEEGRPPEDDRDRERSWGFKHFRSVPSAAVPSRHPGAPQVTECSDKSILAAHAFAWGFVPHVRPILPETLESFMNELARQIGVARGKLDAKLNSADQLRDLLINHKNGLVKAYKKIKVDLNVTSLSILSLPLLPTQNIWWYDLEDHSWHRQWPRGFRGRTAWLGTGDAALKAQKHASAFATHYAQHVQAVRTMTLPHHGSAHNFNSSLLQAFSPIFAIAPADKYSDWNHPSAEVVRCVAEHGSLTVPVTSSPNTLFVERFLMEF